MSVKDVVGEDRWSSVKETLENCWPDEKSEVSDEMVDELFRLAKHEWGAGDLSALSLDPPRIPAKNGAAPPARFYLAYGKHSRGALSKPHHEFTGELPMVRIQLPDTGDSNTAATVETEGGDCAPADRLFPSIDVLWARYQHDPLLTFGLSQVYMQRVRAVSLRAPAVDMELRIFSIY